MGLRRHHQEHARRDEEDDADQSNGESLEAEEERKAQDEHERGRLAHGCQREIGGLISATDEDIMWNVQMV